MIVLKYIICYSILWKGLKYMSKKNSFFRLEMLFLKVLDRKDCYGYEISKLLSEGTNNLINIKEGVLYPILYKLLENKHISSYEKQVGRKIRVYYHIEPSGEEKMFEMIKEYRKLTVGIDNLISIQVGDNVWNV